VSKSQTEIITIIRTLRTKDAEFQKQLEDDVPADKQIKVKLPYVLDEGAVRAKVRLLKEMTKHGVDPEWVKRQ
jgi:hypothetical protein